RTKIDVFDWLMRNEDKRVGKNPAGYLVASIRSDYQVPGDYRTQASGPKPAGGEGKENKSNLRQLQIAQRRVSDEVQSQRDKIREAKLRAAWERLPEPEREAILTVVKAENPGLGRWKNMLEPLCLSVLETRMNETRADTGQRLLFPDAEPVE
ncbi:MAG: replication initiator protein A, partial [Isosphaerales bacterium]